MTFDITLVDFAVNGIVTAAIDTLTSEISNDKISCISYQIAFPNGKMILYRPLYIYDWFPLQLNGHYPDAQIKSTMAAIVKYENENKPEY